MLKVYLIDGTYELFRHFFAVPPQADLHGSEIGAVRGVLESILGLMESGATHIGVATDHIVESFRNQLFSGYKTSEGIPPTLHSQFPILEDALRTMGVVVWPMVEFEADDALAAAAAKASADPRVEQVLICSPDKDLAQCVTGDRIVQLDRRKRAVRNESGVVEKWGVSPGSIPDFLALVGDTADGYPGLPGWGEKSAGTVLGRYCKLEAIPPEWRSWPTGVRGAQRLAANLFGRFEDALLYRTLATLRLDAPVMETVDELLWRGPTSEFQRFCDRIQATKLAGRCSAIAERSKGAY